MFENSLLSAFFQSDDTHDLVDKARIANNLAHMSNGDVRDSLFSAKISLLCRAIELMPGEFVFSWYDERGLIGLRHTPTSEGFHLPASRLTAGARAAMVQALEHFLTSPPKAVP